MHGQRSQQQGGNEWDRLFHGTIIHAEDGCIKVNPGTTVSCDGVNCPLFSTRLRESRWQPPRVSNTPLMGGMVVSLSVVLSDS